MGRGDDARASGPSSPTLEIDLNNLEDKRCTLMIRNIPNRWVRRCGVMGSFTQEVLLHIVNVYIRDRFDFFYLPIDFHTQCNLGYCYINVIDTATVRDLYINVVSVDGCDV